MRFNFGVELQHVLEALFLGLVDIKNLEKIETNEWVKINISHTTRFPC